MAVHADPLSLIHYYESGKYFAEIEALTQHAIEYLQQQLHQKPDLKHAVIFDIDETCLSHFKVLKETNFPQERESLLYLIFDKHKETMPLALPGVHKLYQYCLSADIAPFLITARPDLPKLVELTLNQLKCAGYTNWQGLFFKPSQNQHFDKQELHKEISDMGYDIHLNIGDQPIDLVGNFAKKHIKLPNPFYTLT